jgi:hypothetical protein
MPPLAEHSLKIRKTRLEATKTTEQKQDLNDMIDPSRKQNLTTNLQQRMSNAASYFRRYRIDSKLGNQQRKHATWPPDESCRVGAFAGLGLTSRISSAIGQHFQHCFDDEIVRIMQTPCELAQDPISK